MFGGAMTKADNLLAVAEYAFKAFPRGGISWYWLLLWAKEVLK